MNREELIDKMVIAVMDDFDFEKVHKVMAHLKWKWCFENGVKMVPTTYRIMKIAEKLLRDVAEHYGDNEFHSISTGGFIASIENGSLSLRFILTEAKADHRDHIKVENS